MIKISFLSLLFTLFNSLPVAAQMSFGKVIGYINQQPVNNDEIARKLYLLKDGEWKEYYAYPKDCEVRSVNDSIISYQHGDTLIRSYQSGRKEVFMRDRLHNVEVGPDGTLCFTDRESKGGLLCKPGNTDAVKKLNVKGWPLAIADNHLIYFDYPPRGENEDDVLAAFYDLKLDVPGAKPVLILNNGFPDNTIVSPDRKYILTSNNRMDANGGPQRLLVDVAGKRISKLLIDKDKKGNAYYSYQDNAFVFFNEDTMVKQVITPGKQKWESFK